DDQAEEDEEEGEVEAREHRPVPGRKRRKGRAAGDDEPDLVPIPDRPDRLEHEAPLVFVPGQEREQHPDAEVEALQHEVPGPEEGDHAEPEDLEIHQYVTTGACSVVGFGGAPLGLAYRRIRTKSTAPSRR